MQEYRGAEMTGCHSHRNLEKVRLIHTALERRGNNSFVLTRQHPQSVHIAAFHVPPPAIGQDQSRTHLRVGVSSAARPWEY
jgi:hypothetical protein